MPRLPATRLLCLLLAVEVLSSPWPQSPTPTTSCEPPSKEVTQPKLVDTNTKKNKKGRETSSSSGEAKKGGGSADQSLSMSEQSGSDASGKGKKNAKKYYPKSTEERHGWRKWHRKCTRCLADEKKKWRDPSINWVCGAYQRARRSFKSLCMMRYRNCQDGTMFVPIHMHKCANDPRTGDHFMYDYKVVLTDDDKSSSDSDSGTPDKGSDDSSD